MNKHTYIETRPIRDESEVVLGCKYMTTWQVKNSGPFLLIDFSIQGKLNPKIKGVKLMSRKSGKTFWTKPCELKLITSFNNLEKVRLINSLKQSKHKPSMIGFYQNITDGSYWKVTDTTDPGRPVLKDIGTGHKKSKSLGNFLSEYIYCEEI